jgi:hypothetical protein
MLFCGNETVEMIADADFEVAACKSNNFGY